MEFFTADTHFGHVSTLIDDHRPFKNIKAYDKYVIKEWNRTAKKGDTIYVIGDMVSCPSVAGQKDLDWQHGFNYIQRINARVVLILGNNEERIIHYFFNDKFKDFKAYCLEKGIAEVHRNLVVNAYGKKFFLTHQIKDGNPKYINLFGHTHLCSGLYHPLGLCVSTDLNHFRLYDKDTILGYLGRKKDYWDPDDNTNYINPFFRLVDGKWINIKKKGHEAWQKYQKINNFNIDYSE